MKRTLTIVGIAVATATVLYGCLTLVTLLSRERTQSTLSFAKAESIQLDLGTGRISITGAAHSGITVQRTVVRGLFGPTYSERLDSDGKLHISSHCPGFASFNCSTSYALTVPWGTSVTGTSSGGTVTLDKVDGDVRVSSSGGGINASGTGGRLFLRSSGGGINVNHSSGPLDLESSGGGITVTESSGPVRASSSGGGVQLHDSASADVDLSSSGGGIQAAFTKPPAKVRISSSGGGVRLVLPRGEIAYAVDASSSGGGSSVKVKTDPESPYTVWLRSSGGSVSAAYAESADS